MYLMWHLMAYALRAKSTNIFWGQRWCSGLSSWLAEQEVRVPIPGLAATISKIGYLLLPGRDIVYISLKRRKPWKQPTSKHSSLNL